MLPTYEQVLEKNPNTVKFVFKQFPLTRIHKYAMPAAIASAAAQKQGKFWEMHDKLYANHNNLSEQKITDIAREIGLDMEQFARDKTDPQVRGLINRDMQEAARNGVRGTPTIYVNGRRLKNRSLAGFQQAIEKELARQKKAAKR